MSLFTLGIPYPDFQLHEIIDPDQHDLNNEAIVEKINRIIGVINQITDGSESGSGASQVHLSSIAPFTSTKLQTFLQELVTRVNTNTGSSFVGSAPITGVTGDTVYAQLTSLKTLLDAVNVSLQNQINAHGTRLTNVEGRATTLETRATSLENTSTSNTSEINSLKTRTTNVEGRTTNLETRATSLEASGSVTTQRLADSSVTSAKIANRSVTADKIASELLENNITMSVHKNLSELDHPDESVTTRKLERESVTYDKLGLDVDAVFSWLSNEVSLRKQKHKVTGDSGTSIQIVSGNANDILNAGLYTFHNGVTNMPYPDEYWQVIVLKHGDDFVTHIACPLHSNALYIRRKVAGIWQPWSIDPFTSVDNGKWAVRTAILGKGGNVIGSHPNSFLELQNGINTIPTGKKWAQGVMQPYSTGLYRRVEGSQFTMWQIVISGLDFTPKLIRATRDSGTTQAMYTTFTDFSFSIAPTIMSVGTSADTHIWQIQGHSRTTDGFVIPVPSDGVYYWVATE